LLELTRPTACVTLITTASNTRRLFGAVDGFALSIDGGRTWQEFRSVVPEIDFRSLEQVVAGHDSCYVVADLRGAEGRCWSATRGAKTAAGAAIGTRAPALGHDASRSFWVTRSLAASLAFVWRNQERDKIIATGGLV
jgi:hypothetical protein